MFGHTQLIEGCEHVHLGLGWVTIWQCEGRVGFCTHFKRSTDRRRLRKRLTIASEYVTTALLLLHHDIIRWWLYCHCSKQFRKRRDVMMEQYYCDWIRCASDCAWTWGVKFLFDNILLLYQWSVELISKNCY